MLFNLLETASSTASESTKQNGMQTWVLWVIIGVFLVAWIIMSYFSNKKRKEQAEAETQKRNAIKPGFSVTTIGGIVGTVVSVDDENNTFVLQTGSDEYPSLLKFDKLAIYTSSDPDAEKLNETETVNTEKTSDESVSDDVFNSEETTGEENKPEQTEEKTEETEGDGKTE